jgi:hypothetical protein
MSGLYVYALTGTAIAPFVSGRRKLTSVDLDGVYAVTARMDAVPAVSEQALREQHEAVIQIAACSDAVLPARFGSFVELEELRRIVAVRRHAIDRALELVRGREQMTVRLSGPGQPETGAKAPPAPSTGTEYLEARRAAATIESPALDVLRSAVEGIVAAERVERGADRVAAVVYHLVAAGAAEAYGQRVEAAGPALAPVTARVSGPWPPFAFAPELIA